MSDTKRSSQSCTYRHLESQPTNFFETVINLSICQHTDAPPVGTRPKEKGGPMERALPVDMVGKRGAFIAVVAAGSGGFSRGEAHS
jgi:hypothetical protein